MKKSNLPLLLLIIIFGLLIGGSGCSGGGGGDNGGDNGGALRITALGGYQFLFQANVGDYSFINTNDAYIIGWQDKWDNLIPMMQVGQSGWVEVILTANGQGLQAFCVTNSSQSDWLWFYEIEHPMVVPSSWVDPEADPNDELLAFWIDSPRSFQYLQGEVDWREVVFIYPQTTEISSGMEFSLTVEVDDVNNIFSVCFDLGYNPFLFEYVGIDEANFLSSDCQTIMSVDSRTAKIIIGITRLSANCGSVSGSGEVAVLTFRALDQPGIGEFAFYNYFFGILREEDDYDLAVSFEVKGKWAPAWAEVH